jgi:N-acetyl-anhydromuramyl-L-alanine amidase AmpD
MMGNRALIAAMAALCLPSCTTEPAPSHRIPAADETLVLDDSFATAAHAYDVPVDLLKAIAYVETGWHAAAPDEHSEGDSDELGRPSAFGVFALRGDNLARGAAAAGLDESAVRTTTSANIAAAAARLAELADILDIATDDLHMWEPVVAQFAQQPDDDSRTAYVEDVMRVLATGARTVAEDGRVVASLTPRIDITLPQAGVPYVASSDFNGAVWRPSPNYSARTSPVTMVVIHTCEGSYSGCWGWLKNSGSGVSAHYVVNDSGSEVTQLVKETSRAWHVSANYDCARAGNQQCNRNGTGVNGFAVGIEHAGFGSQASWSNGLLETSAKLTCDITKRHNIPRDKFHIIAHGTLQPANRTDPGANWPWQHYLDRVRAHCGDTGTTPTASTITIDSNNANNNAAVARLELAGTWTSSSAQSGYYGSGYWTANTAQTSAPATFWFYLPTAQTRTVEAWWTSASNRATAAPFIAFDADGNEVGRRVVNQQGSGSQWVPLGAWNFQAGWNRVVLSRWGAAGKVVVADAVRVR